MPGWMLPEILAFLPPSLAKLSTLLYIWAGANIQFEGAGMVVEELHREPANEQGGKLFARRLVISFDYEFWNGISRLQYCVTQAFLFEKSLISGDFGR